MNRDYELLNPQKSKIADETDVDIVKTLEHRRTGIYYNNKHNVCPYDLQVHAEDVFVRKKFDELRCEMPGTPKSTFLMVFSPDGSKVASTHGNHNIYVTDVRTGKNIKTLIGHPRTPWCIAFHPTSNQILASGCLGGQVRIWDLSGGSEAWTSEIPTVIASIAFHPDDRLLVIATYNELYFWDWSKPEPFMHVATGNIKEKVRYVAFDKLGQKLITGISNGPQTRWERVRAPVPVPRQVDRSASPYRRRITPRLISSIPTTPLPAQSPQSNGRNSNREPLSAVPERERRITTCYQNLVREYERLVHRYLQIYRPPTMIDQGTDPMEIELTSITGSNLPVPSTSGTESNNNSQTQASSNSSSSSENDLVPSNTVADNSNAPNNTTECPTASSPVRPPRPPCPNPDNFSQASTSPSVFATVNSTYSAFPVDQSRPIDLSTSPTSESSPANSNAFPSPRESRSATLTSPSFYQSQPTLETDMFVLTPSNICSLRRSRNIRSTQTQGNDYSAESEQANGSAQNRNERRNSAPASTTCGASNTTQQTGDVQNGSSQSRTANSVRDSYNLIDKYMASLLGRRLGDRVSNNSERPSVPTTNTNQRSSSADNSSSRISPRPSGSQTSTNANEQAPDKSTTDVKTGPHKFVKGLSSLNNKRYQEILKEIKSITSMGKVPDQVQSVNVQATEQYLSHLASKWTDNVPTSVEKILAAAQKNLENLRPRQDENSVNTEEGEPRPSTSGIINARASENYDSSNSRDESKLRLPKKEHPRFYEHTRKRLYPTILKKSRRPIIDSSSDSSSSDEDGLTTKRLCTPRIPTLSAASSNVSVDSNAPRVFTTEQTPNNNDQRRPGRPINFNQELEILVTDLLTDNENSQSFPSSQTASSHNNQNCPGVRNATDRVCKTCDGNIENNSAPQTPSSSVQANTTTPVITNSHACPRSTEITNTRTTNTTIYTSPGTSRISRPGRFFSHRVSAFYPTRIQNTTPLRRSSRLRLPGTFALDEVINYSEREGTEEETQEPQVGFHPFDPPPEFATINPENIGIGNMYSNIVQELESSLNDVTNITASNRLGETSDMLSSFSERLESIMNQSNAILRNLRTSIDTLQPTDQNLINFSSNPDPQQQPPPPRTTEPRVLFSDNSFYLREQRNNQTSETSFETPETPSSLESSTSQEDLFSNRSSIASDHTYPLNSRNSPTTNANMTPLMASLHLTVSHIQRQARLLRQQVESIERIDRAMLEVAQLQMMRQMFIVMQYFRAVPCNDNRSAVSSVRQMMAGTRISDSSPYDSPNEESTNENETSSAEAGPSTNNNSTNVHQSSGTQTRSQSRKSYPRCIFLMHRNFRRGAVVGNILQRRCLSRERMMRRYSFRRSYAYRSLIPRTPIDLTTNRTQGTVSQLSAETLRSLTRRLENYLMEHGRNIGRVIEPNRASSAGTDKDEYIMMLRLNQCRTRILGHDSYSNIIIRRQTSSVTADGSSRLNAREILTIAIENLSRHVMLGASITPSLRLLIWNVVDLSLLLSEILLLQIVDSIPPPSGINLDSERESLSTRIDQMCSRMLQNRLSGHSQQLTRSLRLTRLAVRHAARALDQTYTARRNSMLPTSHNRDQRSELLEEINNCLRSIRRHGLVTQMSSQRTEANPGNLWMTEWYRTIHSLINRYSLLEYDRPSTSGTNTNSENAAQTSQTTGVTASTSYTQASSDEDNEPDWYNNLGSLNNNNADNSASPNPRGDRSRPLYRTSNVNLFNLLNNEDPTPAPAPPRNRPWNVPTVQVNDVPISQYQSPWHPSFLANRQRLSERFAELRAYPVGGIFRPRFLHPLHAGNPFEADFDDSLREQIYDSDIMTPVTPNHRIQVWEFSSGIIPTINNALKNVVVNECKIHNDASVDIASNGNLLVTLLPSGGYLNGTNRLGVYSLKWESLGQCLYLTNFEQNAVSVSLSPLGRHLVVGLASRRVSIMPSEKWTMARIFVLEQNTCSRLLPVREVEQTRDPNYMSVNCIRWLPVSGQGLVYATNTGQLRILT